MEVSQSPRRLLAPSICDGGHSVPVPWQTSAVVEETIAVRSQGDRSSTSCSCIPRSSFVHCHTQEGHLVTMLRATAYCQTGNEET